MKLGLYCQKYRNSKNECSFAALHPKHYVLPGSLGTQNICMCTYQQNVKVKLRLLASELITNSYCLRWFQHGG